MNIFVREKDKVFEKENKIEILEKVKKELCENKAEDCLIIDLKGKSDIADFYLIATGNSSIHLNMLASLAKKIMKEFKMAPLRREGILTESRWLIIDYGFALFHFMTRDFRKTYDIENLWTKEIKKKNGE